MVFPLGSVINALAILVGGALGLLLHGRLPEKMRQVVFQGLGLCVLVIGMQMALQGRNGLLVVLSILIGGILGEVLAVEDRILRGGNILKRAMKSGNARFTEGFLAATLLFCIGSMAIIGPLQEGLSGDRSVVLDEPPPCGEAAAPCASPIAPAGAPWRDRAARTGCPSPCGAARH